jgi:hypothetical protein
MDKTGTYRVGREGLAAAWMVKWGAVYDNPSGIYLSSTPIPQNSNPPYWSYLAGFTGGDSGGGHFLYNQIDGTWRLIGITQTSSEWVRFSLDHINHTPYYDGFLWDEADVCINGGTWYCFQPTDHYGYGVSDATPIYSYLSWLDNCIRGFSPIGK